MRPLSLACRTEGEAGGVALLFDLKTLLLDDFFHCSRRPVQVFHLVYLYLYCSIKTELVPYQYFSVETVATSTSTLLYKYSSTFYSLHFFIF